MKRLFTIAFLLIFLSTMSFGQFKFGAGLDTNFDLFGVSGKVNYQVNEEYAGQVGFTYYFNDSNPTRIDVDALYSLTTAGDSDEIVLKGLGGFNYWSSGIAGVSSELGFNIGANISFPINDLNFFIEPRITIVSRGDFFVAAGIYF